MPQSPPTPPTPHWPSRTALVTGAGRRIGRAIAVRLANEGYGLAIHCHNSVREAGELVDHLVAAGKPAALVSADLADVAGLDRLIDTAASLLGPVTLLVNNAALFEADEAERLDPVLWERHFAINLRAPCFLSGAFARALPRERTGSIVNIIDQKVLKLTPQFFSYTLAKSALWTATQTLAQALAPRIRVNAIGPGPTLANARQSAADFDKQAQAVTLGRAVEPQAIAEAVAYLAAAGNVTGQLIAVDGGQHLAWRTNDTVGFVE
jgi:NAD(P)-dependent dehydrogenase (short-subunit alcohol dehydrogenase family)